MIEQDLKEQLEKINKNIEVVAGRIGGSWKAFWYGLLRGFGSILGVAIAIALLGWLLNSLGYIPALESQANSWKEVIERAQNATPLKSNK